MLNGIIITISDSIFATVAKADNMFYPRLRRSSTPTVVNLE